MTELQMKSTIKAMQRFLKEETSRVKGAKEYVKQISKQAGTPIPPSLASGYYKAEKNYTWIYKYMTESDFWDFARECVKNNYDYDTFENKIIQFIYDRTLDESLKVDLENLYRYIQGVNIWWYIGTNIIGHEPISKGKRNKFDNNIYTFDIETTSYIILDGKQYNPIDYLEFTQEEKERSIFQGTMYIWMFGINDKVYYGRTYKELYNFLNRIEFYTTYEKKIVYVHNLAFEFNWLRNIFKFKNVMARKSRKVMKCEIEEYNIEFRCTLFMTNSKLEKIPDLYKFEVKKLVGQLDYSKIRHSETKLSKKELEYCENDCLIIYEYIKKELETYETTKNTPLTSTSHVRRELKELIDKNWDYLNKTRKSINVDGHIYNMMVKAFAGRIHTR